MNSSKAKIGLGLVVLLVLILLIFELNYGRYAIFGGAVEEHCYPLEGYGFRQDDTGAYIPPTNLTCVDGAWVNKSKTTGKDAYCDAYFRLIEVEYTEQGPIITKTEAKGNEFCRDGRIVESPPYCGDYECNHGETDETCWVDCGIIQDWYAMKQVENDKDLATYLEEEDVFISTPEVEKLAKEVEATKPASPFFAVKTLTRLLNDRYIYYVPGNQGGNRQCGEDPEIILTRGYGNCVDYSVVMIAVLRRGFDIEGVGRVRIPARQVAGCLAGYSNWRAVEYSASDDVADLRGEIIGHSWVEVYVGNGRWILADPTTNTALAKSWFGYHKVEHTDDKSLCYITAIEDRRFCQAYSEQ